MLSIKSFCWVLQLAYSDNPRAVCKRGNGCMYCTPCFFLGIVVTLESSIFFIAVQSSFLSSVFRGLTHEWITEHSKSPLSVCVDAFSQNLQFFFKFSFIVWPQIFLFPETKDFCNFSQGKTGLKHQSLRFGGLEVAENQAFTLLSNIAHKNLLMKELLIRGQEKGFESKLVLFIAHHSAGFNPSAQARGTGR